MSKNKGGRPKGSGNVFKGGDQDIHAIAVSLYGPIAWKIAQIRREHIKKGCHTCMGLAEDRLYGKPQQVIKQTGHKQPPLFLVKMGDVKVQVIEQPEAATLLEAAEEGEYASIEAAGS